MRAAERSQQVAAAGANAWATVDRMIVNRAPSVPYANDLQLTLLSRRVGNYQFNPQWGPPRPALGPLSDARPFRMMFVDRPWRIL